MQRIIYHLHDVCCKHSTLTLDDAVNYAIKHGYKEMYWTEHCPVSIPCGYQHRRAPFEQLKDLKNRIEIYNNKYKGKLHVYFGYEVEYNKPNRGYFEKLARDSLCDFLILGVHFYDDIFKRPGPYDYVINDTHSAKRIKEYLEMNKAGMESGLFSGAPHPEIGLNSYAKGDKYAKAAAKEIIALAIKTKTPLGFDINFKTLENKSVGHYPSKYFGKLVSKTKIKTIIESDAHCLEKMTVQWINQGRLMAKDFGISKNVVDTIPIKGLHKKPLLFLYEEDLNKHISPSLKSTLIKNNVHIVKISSQTNLTNICKKYKVHPVGTCALIKKTSTLMKARNTSMFNISNLKGSDISLRKFSKLNYEQFLKHFITEIKPITC